MTIALVLSKACVSAYRSPRWQQGGPWADPTGTYPEPPEGQRVVPYIRESFQRLGLRTRRSTFRHA